MVVRSGNFEEPPYSRLVLVPCLANRSALLDPARSDGQEAPGHPGGQHRQVPLPRLREPHPHHPLAEKREGVQGGAADGWHQGKISSSRLQSAF